MKNILPAFLVPMQEPLPDTFFIVCYENEILPFFEEELERLYGNVFSSIAHFVVYGELQDAGAFLVYRDSELVTVLLFRRDKRRIDILNEGIPFSQDELARLMHFIFDRFASVSALSFHAVTPSISRFHYPYLRARCCEDIVLTLPETFDQYIARLGKASRKSIRQHLSRAQKAFPDFRFDIYQRGEIMEADVRRIIELNKLRMAGKKKASTFDEAETVRICRLAQLRGFVGVLRINGKLCAGTICYRIGSNYSSRVNAHDPAYDRYRFGTLCCFMTICACIERGGREFHFLWGRYAYKYLLLGVNRELDNLTVFRSWPHALLHAGSLLRDGADIVLRRSRALAVHAVRGVRKMWLTRSAGELPPAS